MNVTTHIRVEGELVTTEYPALSNPLTGNDLRLIRDMGGEIVVDDDGITITIDDFLSNHAAKILDLRLQGTMTAAIIQYIAEMDN